MWLLTRFGFCILNHEDRKEKMLAHLAAEQLDRVMDREEVARHIVDSAVAIHSAIKRPFSIVDIESISWLINAYSSKTQLLMRSIPSIEPSCLPIWSSADVSLSSSLTGRSHVSRMESSAWSGVNDKHETHKYFFFAVFAVYFFCGY